MSYCVATTELFFFWGLTGDSCQNCQKNAVVCEGYPLKEIWKSGRQRMADGRCILHFDFDCS